MKWRHLLIGVLLLTSSLATGQTVLSLKIDDAITPSINDYIQRGIEKGASENAEAILIELNTPGGMLKSTRKIVGNIMDAPLPVIVYVYPKGSRAGSAGLFITLSGHLAAMAPGTNIGASHPIIMNGKLDSIENAKVTNDALAFIRSIAQKRKKDTGYAEKAVQQSLSYTNQEALKYHLIDLIAKSPRQLLQKVNGDTIPTTAGEKVLHTREAQIQEVPMSFSEKLTTTLSNPNLMYILLIIGILGILFEFFNPGGIIPGVGGAIALLLALYGMSILPINYIGFALLLLGVILLVLEIKIVSHGILAIGGAVALFFGSIMLLQTPEGASFLNISLWVIITATVLTTLFFLFAIGMGLRAQRNKVASGKENMVGQKGTALENLYPTGKIKVRGEIWTAESLSGNIKKGEQVVVTEIKALKLLVKPALEEDNH